MTDDPRDVAASNVVLVGMRASGKTFLGARLAERLGRPFADGDDVVARLTGRDPDALLAEDGEAAFRAAEARALDELASLRGHVIATGGGAVLHRERFAALAATGVVAHLEVARDELVRRARARPRPPLTGLDPDAEVDRLLAERGPLYRAAAQITVPADRDVPILALIDELRRLGIGPGASEGCA